MTKARLIAAFAVAIISVHATAAQAAEDTKATASASESAVTPPAAQNEADSLFTRVNGTYRKSEKQLVPQT